MAARRRWQMWRPCSQVDAGGTGGLINSLGHADGQHCLHWVGRTRAWQRMTCCCRDLRCLPVRPAGYDGFSWPPNALLVAGFSTAPPSDLAPVFGDRIARVEDRQAA